MSTGTAGQIKQSAHAPNGSLSPEGACSLSHDSTSSLAPTATVAAKVREAPTGNMDESTEKAPLQSFVVPKAAPTESSTTELAVQASDARTTASSEAISKESETSGETEGIPKTEMVDFEIVESAAVPAMKTPVTEEEIMETTSQEDQAEPTFTGEALVIGECFDSVCRNARERFPRIVSRLLKVVRWTREEYGS